MARLGYLTLIIVLAEVLSVSAQDKITLVDAKEISYRSKVAVQGLERLYNYISFTDNVPSELEEVITNSYKPSANRIFFAPDIIVEDDLDPEFDAKNTKDVPLAKYLTDMDLSYLKTPDASITFSNYMVSAVKKKEYMYVRVKFDENFTSKFKPKNTNYPLRQREALLRIENIGVNKWQALIVGLNYYDQENPINSEDKNIQVTTDTSSTASIVTQEEFVKERESFILALEAEERRKQAIFDEYVTLANASVTNKQFKEALELYQKAKDMKPLVPTLDKKILDAKRLAALYTYENFKGKGDKAKGERRYKEAIALYQQALALKPEASAAIAAEISPLNKQLSIIALPANKLQSAQLDGALEACDKILKDNKKTKADFPEVYLIMAMAYQKKFEQAPSESRLMERALENYNLAIKYFPNYLDARIARANFLVQHKTDYDGAISDYDVLTINALDDDASKPGYFVAKAKWKDRNGNSIGSLEDYEKAISLNATNASTHFYKGELQYRLQKYPDAKKSFDIAITLNPKYNEAYYYRGLNYVALKDNVNAGSDFITLDKLKPEAAQSATIDSISNAFFMAGQKALESHNFITADSAYNDALKIRKCNAEALHGKAEIRYRTANEAKPKSEEAIARYNEAIDLNKQAILCNNNFSDAHFKQGRSYNMIADNKQALKSYSEAIRSDANNVQAYIQRGNTYQGFENYPKAVEDYGQAIKLLTVNYEVAKKGNDKQLQRTVMTDLSLAQQLYGEALYNNQDYVTAMVALNQSIAINEFNAEAYYYKGLVNVAQQELSKSFSNYKDAIKVNGAYKYFYAYGEALYNNKDYEEATANFSNAINQDTLGTVANRFYLRGRSLYKTKLYEQAAADFAQYEKIGVLKSDTAFNAEYGFAELYINKDAEAIRYFEEALKLRENDANALFGLGCAYAKAGQFEKSLSYMEKAFATRMLNKNEIKPSEKAFLDKMNDVKANRTQYNKIKKTYLDN
jgi:tetratricopeptide (TPR) repeat protein